MRRPVAQAIVTAALDSVADGLLDVDDLASLTGPMSLAVLAGPPLGRQTNPDGRSTNGLRPMSQVGGKRVQGPLNVTNGRVPPDGTSEPGRPADRTCRQVER